MPTFSAVRARIAGELDRTDLDAAIADALRSAVAHHAAEPWWFLETELTAATAAGVATYALPADFVSLVSLRIDAGATGRPLSLRSPVWMEARSPVIGVPRDVALYGGSYRLWPTPADAWASVLRYRRALAPPDDDEANDWTTTAEALIRSRAEADIRLRHLMEPSARQEALAFAGRGETFLCAAEKAAWLALRRRQHGQAATGRLRPTAF